MSIGEKIPLTFRDFPKLVVQFFIEMDDWTLHSLVTKEMSRNFGIEFHPPRIEREDPFKGMGRGEGV